MANNSKMNELFHGFSKLSKQERLSRLVEMGALTREDVKILEKKKVLDTSLAEDLIENVIGYFQIPLGVAAFLNIDGKDYAIPMAVEETSIIASLSKTAKWISKEGSIHTEIIGSQEMIGQIQIANVKDFAFLASQIESHKIELIQSANSSIASGLFNRGGGVKDIVLRKISNNNTNMAVLHIMINTCDAMGANIVTQVCEFLKPLVENLTNETVSMCILSNLSDQKLTKATVRIKNIDKELGQKIQDASTFAELDPYRAATNNKGVLNGIDPILIATGNDWRAVEASIHAYAARDGSYKSITKWKMEKNELIGEIIAPINVGIVGGVTKLHPTAQLCLKMMKIKSASQLSRVIAAAGLVQNLGAITALTTVGLVQGHMKLHISNLSLNAGAKGDEIPILHKKLEELLQLRKMITLSNAIEILKDLRAGKLTKLKVSSKQEQTA